MVFVPSLRKNCMEEEMFLNPFHAFPVVREACVYIKILVENTIGKNLEVLL